MAFSENLGTIACRCVVTGDKPVLAVSHAGGDWQMYCAFDAHDFNDPSLYGRLLVTVHIAHLVNLDNTLVDVAELPVDVAAEREFVGGPWRYSPDGEGD